MKPEYNIAIKSTAKSSIGCRARLASRALQPIEDFAVDFIVILYLGFILGHRFIDFPVFREDS